MTHRSRRRIVGRLVVEHAEVAKHRQRAARQRASLGVRPQRLSPQPCQPARRRRLALNPHRPADRDARRVPLAVALACSVSSWRVETASLASCLGVPEGGERWRSGPERCGRERGATCIWCRASVRCHSILALEKDAPNPFDNTPALHPGRTSPPTGRAMHIERRAQPSACTLAEVTRYVQLAISGPFWPGSTV